MSISTRSSLTALALIAMAAAVPQTTSAADKGCKDTGAPSALSAQLKASTARTAVMAQRAPAGRVVAKPCDDKKTIVNKAPTTPQATVKQPTRLKVKLKKKFGNKMTAGTTPAGPKKLGGKLGVIDTNPGGGPSRPVGDKAIEPGPVGPVGDKAIEPTLNGDGVPRLTQTSGHTAYVPTVHAECSSTSHDCYRHNLANPHGNLTVKAVITVHCPPGETVDEIKYWLYNSDPKTSITPEPNQPSASVPIEFEPWYGFEFHTAAAGALGDTWSGGIHNNPNTSATVVAEMTKKVHVKAFCSNQITEVEEQVSTMATFHDLDFHKGGPGIVQNQELSN